MSSDRVAGKELLRVRCITTNNAVFPTTKDDARRLALHYDRVDNCGGSHVAERSTDNEQTWDALDD